MLLETSRLRYPADLAAFATACLWLANGYLVEQMTLAHYLSFAGVFVGLLLTMGGLLRNLQRTGGARLGTVGFCVGAAGAVVGIVTAALLITTPRGQVGALAMGIWAGFMLVQLGFGLMALDAARRPAWGWLRFVPLLMILVWIISMLSFDLAVTNMALSRQISTFLSVLTAVTLAGTGLLLREEE